MRSPLPTPGRNRLLENVYQQITKFIRTTFQGSQRSLILYPQTASSTTRRFRQYDLEIREFPLRDQDGKARELIEMAEYCPEVATAIEALCGDVLSSADGDDQGVAVGRDILVEGEYLDIDDQVYEIATQCLERVFNHTILNMICERFLSYGDCFGNLDISTAKRQVNALLILPTWEVFRLEDNGQLLGFEQRRRLNEEAGSIAFHPLQIVHWRFRRKNLYGRSLFNESGQDWARLKDSTIDLANAARDMGIRPRKHIMPEGADDNYKSAYQADHEQQLADGIITHYYLLPGQDVQDVGSTNPDLKALSDAVVMWRSRIVMKSHVPFYQFPGLPLQGAKDIASQPAMAYARFINQIRGVLTEGIRQVIDTELALKGIDPGDPKNRYRIVYPKISVNIYQGQDLPLSESDDIADTEPNENNNNPKPKQSGKGQPEESDRFIPIYTTNGNGRH